MPLYHYPRTKNSKYKAVGNHVFAGGFALGMATKFKILEHLEDAGRFGVDTFRLNFPDVPVTEQFKDWNATRYKGKVDVVYGNPPCAAFSPVGRSMRRGADNWKYDERMEYSRQMNTLLGDIAPTIWVHECVPEILTRGREYSQMVAREAMEHGYKVTFFRHDAKLFGMPMQRRRVFTIAHKVELEIHDPPCFRNTCGMVFDGIDPSLDHWHFGLGEDRAKYVGMVRNGEADNLIQAWEICNPGSEKGRPRMFEGFINPDLPAGSQAGQGPVMIHPWEDRYISAYEIGMIAGYPPDYKWSGLEWYKNWGSKEEDPKIRERHRWGSANNTVNEMVRAVTPCASEYMATIAYNSLKAGKPVTERKAQIVERWARTNRLDDYSLSTWQGDFAV